MERLEIKVRPLTFGGLEHYFDGHTTISPKSNSAIEAIDSALFDLDAVEVGEIPDHLRDAHYAGGEKAGAGEKHQHFVFPARSEPSPLFR